MIEDEQIAGITQDVWASYTEIEVEPSDDSDTSPPLDAVIGLVHVEGAWSGSVVLTCSTQLAQAAAAAMLARPLAQVEPADVTDALGELANIVGGNVKSMLPGPSSLSLPIAGAGGPDAAPTPGAVRTNRVLLAGDHGSVAVSLWHNGDVRTAVIAGGASPEEAGGGSLQRLAVQDGVDFSL